MRRLLPLLALTLVACGGTPGGGAGHATSAKAGSVAPVPGAASGGPAQAPGSHPGQPGGTSGSAATPNCWPLRGGGGGVVSMSGITTEADTGYDRVVVQFDSAIASYQLKPNPAGMRFTSNGQPVSIGGSFGLLLQLSGVITPKQIQQNSDLQLQSTTLQELQLVSTAGTTAVFAIGLSKDVCPRVSTLGSPPQLIFDFPA